MARNLGQGRSIDLVKAAWKHAVAAPCPTNAKPGHMLLAELGHTVRVAVEEIRCFPSPERLLTLTSLPGLNAVKVERLRGVARAALDGLLDVNTLRALGDEAAPTLLRSIPGIGPF